MKIYTRTGDRGQTGLVGGDRIEKNSRRISAIGDVDELNASIGVALCRGLPPLLEAVCLEVQNRLFDLGSELASPRELKDGAPHVSHDDVLALEASIDRLTEALEPLRQFVLPGGTEGAASLHFARCVCRRAERSVLTLSEDHPVRSEVLEYLNRLSDWLFTAARTSNAFANVSDVAWKKKEQH